MVFLWGIMMYMNTILKRVIMFLIVVIIFAGLLLNYIYRSSKADRITTNEEYLEQLKNASAGKNLPGNVNPTLAIQKERGPIETIFESFFSFFDQQ